MRRTSGLLLLVAVVCGAEALQGQFSQYNQPGSGADAAPSAGEEAFESAMEAARWRLGPLYLEPWVGLRRLTWNSNPLGGSTGQESDGDLTGTVAAGLQGIARTGPAYWTVHALPEYVWWADQTERRRLNQRYGAAVHGFFNRLTLESGISRSEQQQIVSAEVPEEVSSRTDSARGSASVLLGFSTRLFVRGEVRELDNELEAAERAQGAELARLDRTERRAEAGLRYQPRERWSVGVGMEWTESDLGATARDLSNSGSGPLLEISYRANDFDLDARATHRSLEAEDGSRFPATDTTTYSLRGAIRWNRVHPTLYASRSLGLALSEEQSHFESDRAGLALGFPLGHRTNLRAFGELGTMDFEALTGDAPEREDDLTSYGVELTMSLGPHLQLRLGGRRTEFDSNLSGFDRELTVIDAGITFSSGEFRIL